MKELNTADSFLKGFNIEIDGKIYTLTPQEMNDFRYLDHVLDGKNILELFSTQVDCDDKKQDLMENMLHDEDICYNIACECEDLMLSNSGDIEMFVVEEFIKEKITLYRMKVIFKYEI